VILHGLRLCGAQQVDILRFLRGKRELAFEAAIEGDLYLAYALRAVPSKLYPGWTAGRDRGCPVVYLRRIALLVRNVAHVPVEQQRGRGIARFGRCGDF